jgi:hypothetical protein
MKNKLFLVVLAMLMVFGLAVSAQAGPSFDFLIFGDGSVFQDGNTLYGSEITVFGFSASGTNNDGFFTPEGLFLNFQADLGQAGGYIGITYNEPVAALSAVADGDCYDKLIMIGHFLDTPFAPQVTLPFNDQSVFSAVFKDCKPNCRFDEYFGISSEGWSGLINLTFNVKTGAVGSGDVTNTPIPGSLVLLGSGLMGLVGIGIRRKSA